MGAARWLLAPAKPGVLDSLAGMDERIATMAGVNWLSWLIRHGCGTASQIPASRVKDFRAAVRFFSGPACGNSKGQGMRILHGNR